MKMVKMYYENDANLGALKGKTIAVIGYGSQGRAQACNLKDSGLSVVIGLRKDSKSRKEAEADGQKVMEIGDACKTADYIQVLIPDEIQGEVYDKEIKQHIKKGKILGFSHGFNVHFGMIKPPAGVDVVMVAPKSPGRRVRGTYEEGFGVPALIAIQQDASGKAKEYALAYAKGIGSTRAGVLEATFKDETETDLFGEQVDLCGGVTEMVKASFDTLTKAGYPPEMAYFETLHELKLITDLIYEGGLMGMWNRVSNTAKYGGLTRAKRIITPETRKEMEKILKEIQSGQFSNEWMKECRENKMANLKRMVSEDANHPIEKVGEKLRSMMKKR